MLIETIEYHSKFALAEPLHAARHFKKVKDGRHIPKERRIYVRRSATDFVVRMVPLEFQLYKDEDDMYFFDIDELKKWDEFDEAKDILERHSLDVLRYYMDKKVREMFLKKLEKYKSERGKK